MTCDIDQNTLICDQNAWPRARGKAWGRKSTRTCEGVPPSYIAEPKESHQSISSCNGNCNDRFLNKNNTEISPQLLLIFLAYFLVTPAIGSCDLRIGRMLLSVVVRIRRDLSTNLNNMHQGDSRTSTRKEVPIFPRHRAILLRRGDRH